jgi:hypothetical protein
VRSVVSTAFDGERFWHSELGRMGFFSTSKSHYS